MSLRDEFDALKPPLGCRRGFTIVDAAGNQLPQKMFGSVTVLPDQNNFAIGKHWQHYDRSWVSNHLAHCAHASWFAHLIAANAEHRPFINNFAGEDFRGLRFFDGHGHLF